MPDPQEITPGGSQVFRHDKLADRPPRLSTGDPVLIEAIREHVTRHLGVPDRVLHEIHSPYVHIDVHVLKPTASRPFYTLVTSGMSERAMKVPSGANAPDRIELVMGLPADWNWESGAAGQSDAAWPIATLRMLARLPHAVESWLAEGHTIPNDEHGTPYDATQLACALIAISTTTPEHFHVLRLGDGREIRFLGLWFLTRDEMDFKLRHGYEALLARLAQGNCSELLDPRRQSSIKERLVPDEVFGDSFAARPARIEARWEDIRRSLRIFINTPIILFALGATLTGAALYSAVISEPLPVMLAGGVLMLLISAAIGFYAWRLVRNTRIIFQHGALVPGLVIDGREDLIVAVLVNLSHSGAGPYYVVDVSAQMIPPDPAMSLLPGARVPTVCTFQPPARNAAPEAMGRWSKVNTMVAHMANSDSRVIASLMSRFEAEEWQRLAQAVARLPKPILPGSYSVPDPCPEAVQAPPPATPPPLPPLLPPPGR